MSQQPKKISVGGLIRRYSKSDQAAIPFIRFGPLFGQDEEGSSVKKAKEEAWKHVVSFSKSNEAETTQICMSSIRNILDKAKASFSESNEAEITQIYTSSIRNILYKAKASYAPDPELDKLSDTNFLEMMLKDGCLFLQLCFSLFRNNVGNNNDGDVKLDGFPHLKNTSLSNKHKWMESILHVGNQIPMVVIRELLKQSYFKKVVQNGKWEEPSFDPAKKALFRILLSPVLQAGWRTKFSCVGKRAQGLMHQLEECCDVLHGIHLLLLGPETDPEKEKYDDDDDDDDNDDVEENRGTNDQNIVTNNNNGGSSGTDATKREGNDDDYPNLKNAVKLKQAGIHFRVTKEGIRGIKFNSSLIYPKLYLPPLFIGCHTQLLLQCLRQYEQNLDSSLHEVSSYLMFMRDLIRTSQDAKILALGGIIKGNRKYVQKLPSMLIDLTGPDNDDHEKIIDTSLNLVKIEINSFYRPPWVTSYFTIVFLLTFVSLIVSIVQMIYAIVAYHNPPPSNDNEASKGSTN